MASVRKFRKTCKFLSIANFNSYVQKDTLALANYQSKNIFSKFTNLIKGTRKTNIQVAISQIKWYEAKFHNLNILDCLFKNKTLLTQNDFQNLFESYMDILESTDNKNYLKFLPEFAKIMNEHNFRRLHKCFNDKLSIVAQEIESMKEEHITPENMQKIRESYDCEIYQYDLVPQDELLSAGDLRNIDIFRELVDECYITPMVNLITQLRSNSEAKDGTELTSERALDILGDDVYTYAQYIQHMADSKLGALFNSNPRLELTPESFFSMYRKILEGMVLTDLRMTEQLRYDSMNRDITGLYYFFEKDIFPQISWDADGYKKFGELCSKDGKMNDMNLPLVFSLIDYKKKRAENNPELLESINTLIESHKREYTLWLMRETDSYYMFRTLYCKESKQPCSYTENDIDLCMNIIEELIKRQEEKNIRFLDINKRGQGLTSLTYVIGDYVIKIGHRRIKERMPNHRRILQPIIRMKNEKMFIEVTDKVDTSSSISFKDVEKVFYEMLEDGYAWMDPREDNMGRLLRKNAPRHGIKKLVQTEEENKYIDDESSSDEIATNLSGKIKEEPLGEGELVILDTDLVIDLRKPHTFDGVRIQRSMTAEMKKKLSEKIKEFHPQEKEVASYEEGPSLDD